MRNARRGGRGPQRLDDRGHGPRQAVFGSGDKGTPGAANGGPTAAPPALATLLGANYPNPFNPSTTFSFALDRDATVSLAVFDLRGHRVRTVVEGRLAAGDYRNVYAWDGRDDQGRAVTSGTYFYRLTTDSGFVESRKMTLLEVASTRSWIRSGRGDPARFRLPVAPSARRVSCPHGTHPAHLRRMRKRGAGGGAVERPRRRSPPSVRSRAWNPRATGSCRSCSSSPSTCRPARGRPSTPCWPARRTVGSTPGTRSTVLRSGIAPGGGVPAAGGEVGRADPVRLGKARGREGIGPSRSCASGVLAAPARYGTFASVLGASLRSCGPCR
ncbi:MAG: T9SS type A sorting domain-containing protein [bacterium]|nr:T9SS type A sorting domain-containing protein [bacterium]